MSFGSSSHQSAPSSPYQGLLSLYQSEPDKWPKTSLYALPHSFREQIFYKICTQNQCPPSFKYGQIHVFDSLLKLQRAVGEVAWSVFQSLQQGMKDQIVRKIWDDAGKLLSEDVDWGENHVADNIPLLLKIMHDSLGSLTPDFLDHLNREILRVLSQMPSEEQEALFMTMATLCKQLNIKEDLQVAVILQAFGNIAPEKRESVAAAIAAWCKQFKITDGRNFTYIVDAVCYIAEREGKNSGAATAALCKQLNITDFVQATHIARALFTVAEQEWGSVIEATAALCKQLNIKDGVQVAHILEAFGAIAEQQWKSAAAATAALCNKLNITDYTQIVGLYTQIVRVLKGFGAIAEQERESAAAATIALYEKLNITDYTQIVAVLKAFGAIAAEQERKSSAAATVALYEQLNIKDGVQVGKILKAFGAIAEQERESAAAATVALYEQLNIKNGVQVAKILKAFGTIAQQERATVAEATIALCKRLNITSDVQAVAILQSLQLFPPDLREGVSVAITSIQQLPQHNRLIASILQQSPGLVEPLHGYLLQLLDSTLNPLATRELAQAICEHQNDFLLFDDHPLVQKAMMLLIATEDMTDPKNPYVIYKKCQDANKEGAAEGHPRHYVIEGQEVVLNSAVFQERNNHRITFSMLPLGITVQTFVKLFEDFQQRIQGLDAETEQEVQGYIQSSFAYSHAFLTQNMTSDDYITSLLLIQGNPNDPAPLQKAYLLCLIQYIQNLPNERGEQKLLSPREESLLALSSSIQSCSIGKAEGIALAYNQLPSSGKLSHAQESGNRTVENALKQLDEIVLTILTDQCSSDNPMMQELTGNPPGGRIEQLSHQALYVKNMIGRLIGLPHSVQFDLHTKLLYDVLVQKSLVELLDVFYQHFPFQRFIDALINRSRQNSDLYPLLTTLLQKKLGEVDLSVIWELDEDGNPTLTKTGALQAWEAAGFISEVE